MTGTALLTDWQGEEFHLEDEIILVREGCHQLFLLNDTAGKIWRGLHKNQSIDEICINLAKEYGMPLPVIQQDVEKIIVDWETSGLTGPLPVQTTASSCDLADYGAVKTLPTSPVMPVHWFYESTYRLNDYLFHVCYENAAIKNAVHPLIAHLQDNELPEYHGSFELRVNENKFDLSVDGHTGFSYDSLDMLAMMMNKQIVSAACKAGNNLIVMHAAAVAQDGHCIVMPGMGGCGKSTLTAALLQAGMTYLSDDIVPIDRHTQQAIPLPISLNLMVGSLEIPGLLSDTKLLHEYRYEQRRVWYYQPPAYKDKTPQGSYPVKYLVFPGYESGASTTLQALTPGQALQYLARSQSVLGKQKDTHCLTDLLDWLTAVPAFELRYESLMEACETVQTLLTDH